MKAASLTAKLLAVEKALAALRAELESAHEHGGGLIDRARSKGHERDEGGLPDDLKTIDAAGLSKMIGRSTKTIKLDASRRPDTLPPRFVIPGSKKLLWRVDDVRGWMSELQDLQLQREEAARVRNAAISNFTYKPLPKSARRR